MLSELRGKVEQIQKGAISNIHNVLFSTLVPFLRFLATGGKNTHTHTHTHTHTQSKNLPKLKTSCDSTADVSGSL